MNEAIFDKREVNKKILRIASPIAIQGLVSATLGVVDDLMVGTLGETELAAVGVACQIFMVHYMIIFGIVSGTATFLAQFYGTRDMANIRKVVGLTVCALSVLGLFFFVMSNLAAEGILSFYTKDPAVLRLAVQYLRINSPTFLLLAFSSPMQMAFKSTQQVRLPMIISSVVFSSNTIINYILIFGKFGFPALGVAGAAIGTVSARVLEFTLCAIFVSRKTNAFRGGLRSYLGWNPELVRRIVKNSTPTTINELLWGLGQTMYAAAFNRIGTASYAAYMAAHAISNIFYMASFSVGDASLIMVGEKLGEGNKTYAKKLATHLIKVAVGAGVLICLLTLVFAKPLTGLFNLSAEGKIYMFFILLIFGIDAPLDLFNGTMVAGTMRAGGDTRFVMFVECSTVWLIAVPLAFISALVWHVPVHIALLITKIESVVKALILLKRFLSGKWMNTVIHGL